MLSFKLGKSATLLCLLLCMPVSGALAAKANYQHEISRLAAKVLPIRARLDHINQYFNQFRHGRDMLVWGRQDYWATPAELTQYGVGDCEDFAIAKWYYLLEAGIDESRMRFAYVKLFSPGSAKIENHLVLFYYPISGEILVLDNMTSRILPLNQRDDLIVQYTFNRQGAWRGGREMTSTEISQQSILRSWHDMLSRLAITH